MYPSHSRKSVAWRVLAVVMPAFLLINAFSMGNQRFSIAAR